MQRQEFPRAEYAARVDVLRRRYPVLALLPHQFLVQTPPRPSGPDL